MFHLSKKQRKLPVNEVHVCSNLCKLLLPATNKSSDPEGLTGEESGIGGTWTVQNIGI